MIVVILFILATFLRFFRLPEFTEFYGDQGMDGILIHNWLTTGQLPLVGPMSSQGLHQGAFYLYLAAPVFIVTHFYPLAAAFLMALLGSLGVCVFYFFAKKVFSKEVALLTSIIFTISPIGIFMSRTYWNSFLLPIGTSLLLYCFMKLREEKNEKWFLITGFVLGCFTQMHYTGILLIAMTALFWLAIGGWQYKKYTLLTICSFLIPLIPFFLFQVQNNFVDLKGLIKLMLPTTLVYRNIPTPNIFVLFAYLFQNFLPQISLWICGIGGALIIAIPFIFKKAGFWHKFLVAWVIAALILTTRNKGDFQLHYLDVLFPLPFLLFGSFLEVFSKMKQKRLIIFGIAGILLVINLSHLNTFSPSEKRFTKTEALVSTMIKEAGGKPFSFTIISPSFSDSHYRYLFTTQNISPVKITQSDYNILFIACEKSDCPSSQTLQADTKFPVTCYDLHCEIEYPKIDLTKWKLVDEKKIEGGILFRFERLGNTQEQKTQNN